jgi:hypothetical protein
VCLLLLQFLLSEIARKERSRKWNKEEDRKETKEVGTRENRIKNRRKKRDEGLSTRLKRRWSLTLS